MKLQLSVALLISTIIVISCAGSAVAFQSRDHLTPQEVDRVKDTQILDKRIDVFIKAIDRRMMVIMGSTNTNAKQLKKDGELWGELPAGSRAELMGDIARILEEAITNIDDVSARDEKNPLIPKSVRKLAAAATGIVQQLGALNKTSGETNSFEQIAENADSVIQAANKLPPEVAKKNKGKGEKPKDAN